MADRKHNNEPLKDLIHEFLKRNGLARKFNELDVVRCYHEEVGPLISKHTRYAFVRGRVLVVQPDAAVIKTELLFARSALVDAINRKMGEAVLDEMEVR
jgi:predicted nucleic acid-binding Zn ribbon protein